MSFFLFRFPISHAIALVRMLAALGLLKDKILNN